MKPWEYAQQKREEENIKFFGEMKYRTNKYFTFQHYQSEDEIVLATNNVIEIKGNPVLLVGNNKAVYLKGWNIKRIHDYYNGGDAYAVKLNRKFFKVYTFQKSFADYYFEKEESFDDLVALAKEQDEAKQTWALGHMG